MDLVGGTGHEDDRKRGASRLQLTMQFKPGHATEMNVQEDAIKFAGDTGSKKCLRGGEGFRGKAEGIEQIRDRLPHHRVILHDRHDLSLLQQSRNP